MSVRIVRMLLGAGLVVGLFAGTIGAATAGPPGGTNCAYFPWAPNGVEIEDPDTGAISGPYYGSITVQNLEDENALIVALPLDEPCSTANLGGYYGFQLGPYASRTLPIAWLNLIPEGSGGGVILTSRMVGDTDEKVLISANVRQTSPTVVTPNDEANASHITISGYTGLSAVGLDDHVYLPIVQTNNNWNTLIRATNFHATDSTIINVELFAAGSGDTLVSHFIITDAGNTSTFDLRDLGVPVGWVGTAEITANVPIGAVAERIKVETNMLLMNPARTTAQASDFNRAALIFRDWNHWNTGVSVANLTGVQNEVSIYFYDIDGNQVHEDQVTLAPMGMDFFYLPAGDGSPFVGSAMVVGTELFHGAVDEVKYLGDEGDTGHAMSYTLDYRIAQEGYALAVPLFRKQDLLANPRTADNSGIQIFNPTLKTAEVEVQFYTAGGNPVADPIEITLETMKSATVYALDYPDLPDGFRGSAIVENIVQDDGGLVAGIVAVTNLVNYDVQYDGSASFNTTMFNPPVLAVAAGVE